MNDAAPHVTLKFWRHRETRNKVVFQEEFNRGDIPVIGTLYVDKAALAALGDPSELTVVVAPAK